MEFQPTPFPGKPRAMKAKTTRKNTEPLKIKSEEIPVLKQRRVFGTVTNTNIPPKNKPEKSTMKLSTGNCKKQPISTKITPKSSEDKTVIYALKVVDKMSPVKNSGKSDKKSVCFKEQEVVENPKSKSILFKGDVVGPQTPVALPSIMKPKIVGTPYHSAENCSKCRFDRLETSSYWIAQIKIAESVGKHFVSANFFRLSLECKSEPNRNMRIELKRYLGRHAYLSVQAEWRDVAACYGLLKNESNAASVGLCAEKDGSYGVSEVKNNEGGD